MSDIELVIKIPEEIYNYVQHIGSINMLDTQQIANAIFDGTPLPKGHGDLIDRRELLKQPIDKAYYPSNYVKFSHAIIEADTSESEE